MLATGVPSEAFLGLEVARGRMGIGCYWQHRGHGRCGARFGGQRRALPLAQLEAYWLVPAQINVQRAATAPNRAGATLRLRGSEGARPPPRSQLGLRALTKSGAVRLLLPQRQCAWDMCRLHNSRAANAHVWCVERRGAPTWDVCARVRIAHGMRKAKQSLLLEARDGHRSKNGLSLRGARRGPQKERKKKISKNWFSYRSAGCAAPVRGWPIKYREPIEGPVSN